jgi:hypothetical protein
MFLITDAQGTSSPLEAGFGDGEPKYLTSETAFISKASTSSVLPRARGHKEAGRGDYRRRYLDFLVPLRGDMNLVASLGTALTEQQVAAKALRQSGRQLRLRRGWCLGNQAKLGCWCVKGLA